MSGQRVEFVNPAPEGSRFAAGAFDGQIGKEVMVTLGGKRVPWGVLREAEVADGGRSVRCVVEVSPDSAAPGLFPRRLAL